MNNIFYVALYIRLSKEDGDKEESDSVENQRKLLLEYIEGKEEFFLKEIYIDDGYSGTNFNRPEFNRMLEDIESKKINCIIVKDLSRFGRDYIETGRYVERYFPEKEVRFIALLDGIDSQKQAYDMLLPIKNIFNEQYARDISKKIHATIKTKQQAGEFIGSFASYGYKKSPEDKNKLVIDEYPASIVRRIFDMYISGMGKQRIARILTNEGIVCPAEYKKMMNAKYKNSNYREQGYWTYSTVNSILHKEIYAGNMVQGTKRQKMRGKQKRIASEEWVVVPQTHEAIIDQETWDKTQKLLNRRKRDVDLETNQNIFAGFIRCADCGAAMAKISWKKADGSKSASFYCGSYKRLGNAFCSKHTLPIKVLEQIILDDLKKIIENIDDLEKLIQQEDKIISKKSKVLIDSQIDKLDTEITKIKRWKQTIYEDYKEEIITKEEYFSYKEDYLKKEKQLLKQDAEPNEKSIFESEWIEHLRAVKEIKKLDREIIVEMIDQIWVYENRKIKIVYNFSDELEKIFEHNVDLRN